MHVLTYVRQIRLANRVSLNSMIKTKTFVPSHRDTRPSCCKKQQMGNWRCLKVLNIIKLYHSEPSDVPYSPNKFLGGTFFAVSYSKTALVSLWLGTTVFVFIIEFKEILLAF